VGATDGGTALFLPQLRTLSHGVDGVNARSETPQGDERLSMRLYYGQIGTIARELCDTLVKQEAIEISAETRKEAELDLDSVLREYIRVDRELNDEARDMVRDRSLGNSAFFRIKRQLAKERNFAVGEEALEWVVDQLIEILLYSSNVDEVFVDDLVLRRSIGRVLNAHLDVETELDKEVRGKLKNLEEGSQSWDIEYQTLMDNLKKQKGFT
jgi:hypothetical protein